jgi:hypothetical protein
MVPSEFPRSLVPMRVCARLLRTLSSKPGRDARCFLKGDAMLVAGSGSGAVLVPEVDDDASAAGLPGTGVPERGDPEASDAVGLVGRPSGSAEC